MNIAEIKFPPRVQMQIDRFGTIDLPYFTLITPQDSVIGTFRFTRSAEEFRTFLQSGLN